MLGYSFGIVKWSKTDLVNLERKIRTTLTKAQKHHPKSAVERVTLLRSQGGRGLVDICKQLDQQITNLRAYFHREALTSTLHKVICAADDSTPLLLNQHEIQTHHQTNEEKMQIWKEKPLHGRHINDADQDTVDTLASNYWLVSGQLFPETEGFVMAIQDQVIASRNYLKYIVKDTIIENDKCRYGC